MLLLTAVTFGGNHCLDAFDGLPESEAMLLRHRAQEMLKVPSDRRVPLLVHEIKRLVIHERKRLATADLSRLARLLESERPALVEVVVRMLPEHLSEPLRKQLVHAPTKAKREVRPEVIDIIRWKLEALTESRNFVGPFHVTDLIWIEARELATLCERMGARALAFALAGLDEGERETFLAALGPDQRELAEKAIAAGKTRRMSSEDARSMLDEYEAFTQPALAMRHAGAQRVMRACLAEGAAVAALVIERHPGDMGNMMAKWLKVERTKPSRKDGGRAELVEEIARLAKKGLVDAPVRLMPPPGWDSETNMPGGRLLPPSAQHLASQAQAVEPTRMSQNAVVAPSPKRPSRSTNKGGFGRGSDDGSS